MTELTSAQLTRRDELADDLDDARAALAEAFHDGAELSIAPRIDECNAVADRIDAFALLVQDAIDSSEELDAAATERWASAWDLLDCSPLPRDAGAEELESWLTGDDLRSLPSRAADA